MPPQGGEEGQVGESAGGGGVGTSVTVTIAVITVNSRGDVVGEHEESQQKGREEEELGPQAGRSVVRHFLLLPSRGTCMRVTSLKMAQDVSLFPRTSRGGRQKAKIPGPMLCVRGCDALLPSYYRRLVIALSYFPLCLAPCLLELNGRWRIAGNGGILQGIFGFGYHA